MKIFIQVFLASASFAFSTPLAASAFLLSAIHGNAGSAEHDGPYSVSILGNFAPSMSITEKKFFIGKAQRLTDGTWGSENFDLITTTSNPMQSTASTTLLAPQSGCERIRGRVQVTFSNGSTATHDSNSKITCSPPPTARLSKIYDRGVFPTNGPWGPSLPPKYNSDDYIVFSTDGTVGERGYHVRLVQYKTTGWNQNSYNIQEELFNGWVCGQCAVPSTLLANDFMPIGHSFRQNGLYYFEVAVGPIWSSAGVWFRIERDFGDIEDMVAEGIEAADLPVCC